MSGSTLQSRRRSVKDGGGFATGLAPVTGTKESHSCLDGLRTWDPRRSVTARTPVPHSRDEGKRVRRRHLCLCTLRWVPPLLPVYSLSQSSPLPPLGKLLFKVVGVLERTKGWGLRCGRPTCRETFVCPWDNTRGVRVTGRRAQTGPRPSPDPSRVSRRRRRSLRALPGQPSPTSCRWLQLRNYFRHTHRHPAGATCLPRNRGTVDGRRTNRFATTSPSPRVRRRARGGRVTLEDWGPGLPRRLKQEGRVTRDGRDGSYRRRRTVATTNPPSSSAPPLLLPLLLLPLLLLPLLLPSSTSASLTLLKSSSTVGVEPSREDQVLGPTFERKGFESGVWTSVSLAVYFLSGPPSLGGLVYESAGTSSTVVGVSDLVSSEGKEFLFTPLFSFQVKTSTSLPSFL